MRLVNLPDSAHKLKLVHGFTEDFDHYIADDRWALTATDSGGCTEQDEAGGAVVIDASDGTVADNDEVYLHNSNEIFLFADDKPLMFAARILFEEDQTTDANVMIGLANAWAANHLQDDGAGPPGTYSGAVFFKADGDANWSVEVSDSTTQTTTELTAANALDGAAHVADSASYQWLEIHFDPYSASGDDAKINFFLDGVHVAGVTYDYANATEMEVGFGVKNGSANEEELKIDACYCYQKR